MTREAFDQLVRATETRFAGGNAALRWRVVLLVIIGYSGLLVWLGLVLLFSLGLFALMGWASLPLRGKVAFGLLGCFFLFAGGYAALRALLVHVPKPIGLPVTRSEAPELFAVLDTLQKELRCPAFHEVLIQPVCNAAVVQVPRLGVFGCSRNYLLLGLPLLEGLSPEEMRAVLAHECAHLSRAHGRLGHWLYRLRRSWEEMFKRLAAPRVRGEFSLRPLARKFVDWFWPRFNAQAFVLSRSNEYEADAQSARLAGTDHAASALARVSVLSRQVEQEFWPALFQLANEQAEPPAGTFRRLSESVRAGPPAEVSIRWLAEALQMTSTNSDTHPCLTERLRALQVPLGTPSLSAPPLSAAEKLLGSGLEKVREGVEEHWRKEIAAKWKDRHARASALKQRLESLGQAPESPGIEVDRLWDKALALLDLEGGKAAKPVLEQIVLLRPDHAPARFHLGRLLLQEREAQGVEQLRRAMELDEQCVPQACSLLHHHYKLQGDAAQLREVDARMDRYEKAMAASHSERREVNARDTFLAHGLTEAELEPLREILRRETLVVRALLARKALTHFPAQRLFVLCVYPRRRWPGWPNHDAERSLITRLSQHIQLPGRLMAFTPTGTFRALARKVESVPQAEIFRRSAAKSVI